jgi:flagellum-specific peptidoglycan hydrolase FlgJ
MDPLKRLFISNAIIAARLAHHPFPEMAACEAALESGYGQSLLALRGNNLFGMKQHEHPEYGTLVLPTREFQTGGWRIVDASFVEYPTIDACFADRVATLERLAPVYPHYKNALAAPDAETYIREVSATWSTDPNRAAKVLMIFDDYRADLPQQS